MSVFHPEQMSTGDDNSTWTTYNTDTFGSWGIGYTTLPSSDLFEDVLQFAKNKKAYAIVKPSRGKFWYIKGINKNKTYEAIKLHIESNLTAKYKPNSKIWLIKYNMVN